MSNNYKNNVKSIFNAGVYVGINNDYSDQDIRHKSLSIANAIINSGCDIIQYRPRKISYFKMLNEAQSISELCLKGNIPFIVNDYVDLALDVNADGIHLSGDEISASHARAILGPSKIIGTTIRSSQQAKTVPLDYLDYVSITNIYSTEPSFPDDRVIGLAELRNARNIIRKRAPDIIIIGIGGVDESNAADVIKCGVDAVSVVTAISHAAKPATTYRKLKKIVKNALKGK